MNRFSLSCFPWRVWWHRVSGSTLRADAMAGLTGAIILVPQGVAFATIAGMPPEYGLYAAMVPAIVAALWGSSWHLVSGPTTAISIVVFATISPLAEPGSPAFVGLVLTLTFLMGLVQLAMGLLRLGTLVNFVSHTVVVGFTAGAAVLIAASQVKNFFGVDIQRGASFFEVVKGFVAQFAQINPYITAVAASTVLVCMIVRHWQPRWPYMIVGMVVGSVVAAGLNHWVGPSTTGIQTLGALQVGLPPLSGPVWDTSVWAQLAPIALAVALLALTEAVSISRAIALKSGQRIDGNQEFIGQGLSNLAGAFFSGYASSGSFNRSGLNFAAGAKTPLAAVCSAVLLLGIVLFLAPLAVYLPTAAMAGILFVVAWGLIDWAQIREVLRVSRQESAVLAVTCAATLTVQLEFAIYIGVLLSLMLYLARTSRPGVEKAMPHPSIEPPAFTVAQEGEPHSPHVAVLRVNGSIFFGAVDHLQEAFRNVDAQCPTQTHLLVVASGINFIDLAGSHWLEEEARRRAALDGGLYFFNLKPEPLAALQRYGVFDAIGADHFFPLGSDPLRAIRRRIPVPAGSGGPRQACDDFDEECVMLNSVTERGGVHV